MKKNLSIVISLAILLFMMGSCAVSNTIATDVSQNAKNQAPPPGKSLVYVYRVSAFGFLVGLNVSLNNKMLGSFFPKKFYLCTLDPGKYVFTGHGENENDLILTTEPDKKYYIEVKPRMGFATAGIALEQKDLVAGNEGVQKCKMIGSTNDPAPEGGQPPKQVTGQQLSQPSSVQPENQVLTQSFVKQNNTALVLGINSTSFKHTMSGSRVNTYSKSDAEAGAYFGYLYNSFYKKNWGFRTGVIATLEGTVFKSDPSFYLFGRIPILAQYNINKDLSLLGGLNFDILWLLYDGKVVFDDKSISRYFNPGLCLGAEYKISNLISLNASYNAGLTNMLTSASNSYGNYKLEMKKSGFLVGMNFHL